MSAQGFWPPCRRHEPHPPRTRMYQELCFCLHCQTERRTQGAILVRYRGSYIHDCSDLPGFSKTSFLNADLRKPLYTPKSSSLTMPPVRIMRNHVRCCELRCAGWQPVRVTFAPEAEIQKEQQKVEKKISNFDPIDEDLPGLVPSKTRRI